jgi:hypothetical protein
MKQKTSSETESRSSGDLRFICIGLALLTGVIICVSFLEHKQQETAAAPAKHDSITTEIPVQRIRCVKPGHNFCLEYRVFNEVRQ